MRVDTLRSGAVVVAISHTGATHSTCLAAVNLVTGTGTVSHHLDNFASRTAHVALLAALHQATAQRLTDATAAGRRATTIVAQHQR